MTSHKLSTIVFAQSFIDTEIEDKYGDPEPDQQEYFEQVSAMWAIVSTAIDELRKENTSLQNKLALIDLARNTET